jgi:hypothetical protein
MESNIKQGVVFRSPRSEQEREQLAGTCVRKVGIKFPAVVVSIMQQKRRIPAGPIVFT